MSAERRESQRLWRDPEIRELNVSITANQSGGGADGGNPETSLS